MNLRPEDHLPRGPMGFADLELPPGEDLVAVGTVLEPRQVLDAYRHGVFPWYVADQPVLWWSPEPRAILPLDSGFHVPRRLARTWRGASFEIRHDTAFGEVIRACARDEGPYAWIHEDMVACYRALFASGHAHSVEVWRAGELVGGLYGVAFGGVFAAESMFHRARDMSKIALLALVTHLRARGFGLLDVQFTTPHLAQFGVREIARADYLAEVRRLRDAAVTWAD